MLRPLQITICLIMEKSEQQPQPSSAPCTVREMRNLRHTIVSNIGGYQERSFAQDPVPPCRFLGLPAELRNRIYGLLLDTGDLDTAFPVILQSCKQIYSEASGILYGCNTFKITITRRGVYAQGVICGGYRPDQTLRRYITKLEWLPFLASCASHRGSTGLILSRCRA